MSIFLLKKSFTSIITDSVAHFSAALPLVEAVMAYMRLKFRLTVMVEEHRAAPKQAREGKTTHKGENIKLKVREKGKLCVGKLPFVTAKRFEKQIVES